ncbi:MAG: hypothetical protein DRP79_05340 [Planctomycetota bacterium]|nr:MAG: hypothetical protein DRP79_05340 [Planctomycetota bacterium]
MKQHSKAIVLVVATIGIIGAAGCRATVPEGCNEYESVKTLARRIDPIISEIDKLQSEAIAGMDNEDFQERRFKLYEQIMSLAAEAARPLELTQHWTDVSYIARSGVVSRICYDADGLFDIEEIEDWEYLQLDFEQIRKMLWDYGELTPRDDRAK